MANPKNTVHLVRQVLKAREWHEEAARGELQDAQAELADRETCRDEAARRAESDLLALRGAHGGRIDMDRLQRLRAWHAEGRTALAAAQDAVQASGVRLDEARQQLGAIVAERRALESLQGRLVAAMRADDARVEGRLADERFAASTASKESAT